MGRYDRMISVNDTYTDSEGEWIVVDVNGDSATVKNISSGSPYYGRLFDVPISEVEENLYYYEDIAEKIKNTTMEDKFNDFGINPEDIIIIREGNKKKLWKGTRQQWVDSGKPFNHLRIDVAEGSEKGWNIRTIK